MKLIFKRFNLPINQMRTHINMDQQYIQWNNWDFVFRMIYQPIITHSKNVFLTGFFKLPNDGWKEYGLGCNGRIYAATGEASEPNIWFNKSTMSDQTYKELMPFIEKIFSPSQGELILTSDKMDFIYDPLFCKLVSGSARDNFFTNLRCQLSIGNLYVLEKTLTSVSYAYSDFSVRDRKWVTSDKSLTKIARSGMKEDLITVELFFADHYILILHSDHIESKINRIGGLVDSASDEYKNRLGDLFLGKH